MPGVLRQAPENAMIEDLSPRGALVRAAKLPLDYTRGHQTLVEGEGGAIRLERARVVVLDPNALERWSEAETDRSP